MLDIKLIRENSDIVKKGIVKKNANPKLVDDFLVIDQKWREFVKKIDDARAKQKDLSEKRKIEEAKGVKTQIQIWEEELKTIETDRTDLLYIIPNLPADDVPVGKDESKNVVLRKWGNLSKFNFAPQDHLQIGESLDIIDVKKAGEIAGSRFYYLKGAAALLEYALVNWVFSRLSNPKFTQKIAKKISPKFPGTPFIPVVPPVMIKPEVYIKMARLDPGQEVEKFFISRDNLYLVGSAEHTLGPLHMDEIIDEAKFPIRYLGFSTAFRREAGSYGKDVRGILRAHQFDKLEMETFSLPGLSMQEQNFIVAIQEALMRELKMPYRVVEICTGDMGGPDVRQIDIETWMPGQNKYRETHTSDFMADYQSRRLNTKVRFKDGKIEFVHMNDATAFAIGRIIIAILENYQRKDGSVKIPEVLQKYMGGLKVIKR